MPTATTSRDWREPIGPGIPTFVAQVSQFTSRDHWDRALADAVAGFEPDLVVLAGFMKLVSEDFLARHTTINTHPALCPSFPGMHGPADALAYGVKVTGATLFIVDGGVDTGPIIAQTPVPVIDDDTSRACTSGSRPPSGPCSSTPSG